MKKTSEKRKQQKPGEETNKKKSELKKPEK